VSFRPLARERSLDLLDDGVNSEAPPVGSAVARPVESANMRRRLISHFTIKNDLYPLRFLKNSVLSHSTYLYPCLKRSLGIVRDHLSEKAEDVFRLSYETGSPVFVADLYQEKGERVRYGEITRHTRE